MTPEAPRHSTDQAPAHQKASEQLRDCMHFVSLLADQMEALEREDFPRVRELEAMRSRLAEEMGGHLDPETPILIWIAAQLDEALSRVQSWTENERCARDQFSQLQDDSLPLVRGIQRRLGSGNYLSLDSAHTKLDLRL